MNVEVHNDSTSLVPHDGRLTGRYHAPEEFIVRAAALPLPKHNQVYTMLRGWNPKEVYVMMKGDVDCKSWSVKLVTSSSYVSGRYKQTTSNYIQINKVQT